MQGSWNIFPLSVQEVSKARERYKSMSGTESGVQLLENGAYIKLSQD